MVFDDKPTRRTLLRSVTAGVTLGLGGLAASTSATATSLETFSLSELEARDDVRLQTIETEADCERTMICLKKFCAPGYTYGAIRECCNGDCQTIENGCLCPSYR